LKATFPVELPLYCAVLTGAAGAVYTNKTITFFPESKQIY